MVDTQKFPYKIIDSSLGMVDQMPYIPLRLSLNGQSLNTEGTNVHNAPYQTQANVHEVFRLVFTQ
ncbi:hypothetical protein [Nostoc sp. UHCC 0251]|uniref:hypothetical protein n=1 Tax=Nostoc sp. UHCC 0251 TaxID=3110240 RepID=UPI002B1FE06D|nr:hypothetical protein [Nostoc sp. UHCC 0251]MEA5626310.1 hypothetical protein [Nostoc sp. UHCC 0251]